MVISTTGHENHCLLITCDFAMIAKCLESFTSSFRGFGFVVQVQSKLVCLIFLLMILADPTRWDPAISHFGFGKNLFTGYSGL